MPTREDKRKSKMGNTKNLVIILFVIEIYRRNLSTDSWSTRRILLIFLLISPKNNISENLRGTAEE
jgi:hypothetical protein